MDDCEPSQSRKATCEERWIECEEIYESSKDDSSHADDYYNIFSESDVYQSFYFTVDHSTTPDEYHFERHSSSTVPQASSIVLRGVKTEYGQIINSTGLTLWRASTILCNFLCTNYKSCIVDKSILELGAGLGLCGIVCYRMGGSKHVVMTDGDTDALDTMRLNVRTNLEQNDEPLNSHMVASRNHIDTDSILPCRQLRWGHEQQLMEFKRCWGSFDVIIGSDIIYMEDSLNPLFETVVELLTPLSELRDESHGQGFDDDDAASILSRQSVFILAYARRNVNINLVLDTAAKHGLKCLEPLSDEGVYLFYQ